MVDILHVKYDDDAIADVALDKYFEVVEGVDRRGAVRLEKTGPA